MSIRKANILELATHAYELEAGVLRGVLAQDEHGAWTIGGVALKEWLARYKNQEIVLVAASLEDDRPLATRVCGTCGREYQGAECPHCRRARRRLRGW